MPWNPSPGWVPPKEGERRLRKVQDLTRPTLLEMVVICTAIPASTALKKEVSSALRQRWD